MTIESLASYQRISRRIESTWPSFTTKRNERLRQQERYGKAAEKVAENILEDLFTQVLDWKIADLNNQIGFADIVLTSLGIKRLVLEVKRPGLLQWSRRSVDEALSQARRYADEQKVKTIAISDGRMLFAQDLIPGGQRERAFVDLASQSPPLTLWWLSTDGLYRDVDVLPEAPTPQLPERHDDRVASENGSSEDILLHPKYHLPYWCFAYVGDSNNTKTWSLPYLCDDGKPDLARLPKAIQSILSNYRGARVGSIPEAAIPAVLETLAKTAKALGKIPVSGPGSPKAYVLLEEALVQLGRWPL